MKNAFRSLVVLTVVTGLLVFQAGCKEDEPEDPKPATITAMNYTVNGNPQRADDHSISASLDTITGKMTISATATGKSAIKLHLALFGGKGTYKFYKNNQARYATLTTLDQPNLSPMYSSVLAVEEECGSVTISEFDPATEKMVGQFSFKAGPVSSSGATVWMRVTEGRFTIYGF